MTLDELAIKYDSDKSSKGHGFAKIYDMILSPYAKNFTKVLEIGVFYGASLKMWSEYFPNASIVGGDIEDKRQYNEGRISTVLMDQGKESDLRSLINDSKPDLIIDDGSHIIGHQLLTLGILFHYLKSGGYYILEDLHTSTTHAPEVYGADSIRNAYKFISDLSAGYHAKSEYIANQDSEYIFNNLKESVIFSNNSGGSITSILRKK